jgi:uncharacterized membrane protein
MPSEAIADDVEPSNTEYSWIWVAYALHAMGAFGFVLGPLVGLIINYVRRDADAAGFIASHHRWLIRTFWWTLVWYVLCIAVILAGAWPIIGQIVEQAIRTGGRAEEFSFGVAWESIFATVGAAMAGGLGILAVWIWNWYRMVRGGFLLADRSPAP